MAYYQMIQNRAAQTVAVINQHVATLSIGDVTPAQLQARAQMLGTRALERDHALAAFDAANNAENRAFVALRKLLLALPRMAQGELDDDVAAESALLDLLAPVFAVDPRNSELAIKRGIKLVSVLARINDYLAARTPRRAPISSGGLGLAELSAMINAHPALVQQVEDAAADVSAARTALRDEAAQIDRLNKRFYSKLKAEARSNAALQTSLAQIETRAHNLPATLSIREIRQGGADNRQLLVAYVAATYDDGADNFVEWRLDDGSSGFSHSLPADPSGNALGPFAVGTRVQLRTRVSNSVGTTTGSVRSLEIN